MSEGAELAAAMTAVRDEIREGVSRLVQAIENTGDSSATKLVEDSDCVEVNGEQFYPPGKIKKMYGVESGTLRQAANDPGRKLRVAKFRNCNLYSAQHVEDLQKQGRLK